MTGYRFRFRTPTPVARDRFRGKGLPRSAASDFGPSFTGGNFREALHSLHREGDESCDPARSKPRIR